MIKLEQSGSANNSNSNTSSSSNGLLDLASDMIKCIGLLAKINFDRNIGVDTIYIKGYLPFTRNLVKMGLK